MKTIFKYLLLSFVVAGMGIIPAYIFHEYEAKTIDERFYWEQWKQSNVGKSEAKLFTLDEPLFDFGTIDPGRTYSREFILENIGDRVLEVWTEPAPNSLVNVDLTQEKIEILANSSYPILISVDGKDVTADFSETITIHSNDVRPGKNTMEIRVTGKLANKDD